MRKKSARGFSLVELLIVITIIALLYVAIYYVINPIEIYKRVHDDRRLTDLENVRQAISVVLVDQAGSNLLCNGSSYPCSDQTNPPSVAKKATDGSGWVKVNIKGIQTGGLTSLPLDPTNDETYHYTYCADKKNNQEVWEIDAQLESVQQKDKMLNINDGGDEDDKYEVGTDLTLISSTGGSCTFE